LRVNGDEFQHLAHLGEENVFSVILGRIVENVPFCDFGGASSRMYLFVILEVGSFSAGVDPTYYYRSVCRTFMMSARA
jgi:hypothetical protein